MLKKLVIVAAAVVVGLGIIRFTKVGRECGGLAELWWSKSGDWAKNSISPETRIEQLEMEIGKINRDIRAAINKRADLKADYVMLKDEVDALKAKQEQRKKDLLVLADLLEQGSPQVVFQGYSYVAKTAQQKLDGLKTAFETGEQSLKAKSNLLAAREERLVLAERQILKIQQKQTELTQLVDQMKTQLANIRMKQMENNTADFDESQVSKCVSLQQDLKRMLLKEEALAEEKARFLGTPVTVPARDESSIADSIKAARAAVAGDNTKATAVDDKPAGIK
jgi:chromosome segregation ATPase